MPGPGLTRAQIFERAGLQAFDKAGAGTVQSKRLIAAFASMLDAAISKPKTKRTIDTGALPFGPKQLFDELEKRCSEIIQLRPYDGASFGRLGRSMAHIQGLEIGDLDRVVSWIESGGLSTWPNTPTWTHVCKHFTTWVAYARDWQARGRRHQETGPGPLAFR